MKQEMLYTLFVVLLMLWLSLCLGLTALGLPGNWLAVAALALFRFLVPGSLSHGLTWTAVGVMVAIAAVAELLEFLAGLAGMAKGGSFRGACLALVGSFVGSAVGATIGIPVPIVGSLAGIILFGALGAMLGAVIGEQWKGASWDKTWSIGSSTFWARVWGSLIKCVAGILLWITALFCLV